MVKSNSRQAQRAPVTLKIKFKSETLGQFIERYSVDISHGGIFIRTKDPLEVGTALKFEFQLKDATPLIAGDGTVVWTRLPDPERVNVAPGMGVRFDRLHGDSQKVLGDILSHKGGQAPTPQLEEFEDDDDAGDFRDMPTRVAPAQLVDQLASHQFDQDAEHTPLPRPMPFHSDAGDFSQETFEESTRVASLDNISAALADHAGSDAVEDPFGDPFDESNFAGSKARRSTQLDAAGAAAAAATPGADDSAQSIVSSAKASPKTSTPELGMRATELAATPPAVGRATVLGAAGRASATPGARNPESAAGPPIPGAGVAESAEPSGDGSDDDAIAEARAIFRAKMEARKKAELAAVETAAAELGAEEGPQTRRKVAVPDEAAASWSSAISPKSAPWPAAMGAGESPRAEVAPPSDDAPRRSLSFGIIATVLVLSAGALSVWMWQSSKSSTPATPEVAGAETPEPAAAVAADVASDASAAETVEIEVVTRPEGATARIAGTDIEALTPATFALEAGAAVTVELSLPGYRSQSLEVSAGETELAPVELAVAAKSIRVTSDPPGALVMVEGRRQPGTTPLSISVDDTLTTEMEKKKSLEIVIRKSGYRDEAASVSGDDFREEGEEWVAEIAAKLTADAPPRAPAARAEPTRPPERPAARAEPTRPPERPAARREPTPREDPRPSPPTRSPTAPAAPSPEPAPEPAPEPTPTPTPEPAPPPADGAKGEPTPDWMEPTPDWTE